MLHYYILNVTVIHPVVSISLKTTNVDLMTVLEEKLGIAKVIWFRCQGTMNMYKLNGNVSSC